MMSITLRSAALISLTSLLALGLEAQETEFQLPTTSPQAEVKQVVANTTIDVAYSRPSARGRTIFGGLIPYDEVWRTGADSATKVSFSTPVNVHGHDLEAGSYELFTIPSKDEWTVIFQPHQERWGSYAYDPASDAARFTVKPVTLRDTVETLTLSFGDLKPAAATLNISWEKYLIPLQFKIDVTKTVVPHLEAALKKDGGPLYFRGAMFYFDNNLDIDRALELLNKALESNPTHLGMLYRKGLMLERKGDKEGAKAAAKGSMESASKASSRELREEYTRLNQVLLDRLSAH